MAGGEGCEGERGSAVPLVVALAAVAVAVMLALVGLGRAATTRAEAQAAADMAALAGLFEGRSGAADLARRNGGRLTNYAENGSVVTVAVIVDGARAQASAEYAWDSASDQEGNPSGG